jgi:hypothetical protein
VCGKHVAVAAADVARDLKVEELIIRHMKFSFKSIPHELALG